MACHVLAIFRAKKCNMFCVAICLAFTCGLIWRHVIMAATMTRHFFNFHSSSLWNNCVGLNCCHKIQNIAKFYFNFNLIFFCFYWGIKQSPDKLVHLRTISNLDVKGKGMYISWHFCKRGQLENKPNKL